MVDDNKHKGFAPPIFQKILRSNYFATLFHILVLVNAISAATLQYDHNTKFADDPEAKLDNIYKAEVITFRKLLLDFQTYSILQISSSIDNCIILHFFNR